MRYLNLILLTAITLSFSGCSKDEEACDRNAPIVVNGITQCANARSEYYRHYVDFQTDIETEEVSLFITFSTGNMTVRATLRENNGDNSNLREMIELNKEYTYANGEAAFIFPGINKTFSGKIIFTKFDRQNKIVSGSFEFSAETTDSVGIITYDASGSFNNISL